MAIAPYAPLVTPFNEKNWVINCTTKELTNNMQNNISQTACLDMKGRAHNFVAFFKLSGETVIDALAIAPFFIAAPFANLPLLWKEGTDKDTYRMKITLLTFPNVGRLVLRTLAVAFAALATLVVGVFICPKWAIKIQQTVGILAKKVETETPKPTTSGGTKPPIGSLSESKDEAKKSEPEKETALPPKPKPLVPPRPNNNFATQTEVVNQNRIDLNFPDYSKEFGSTSSNNGQNNDALSVNENDTTLVPQDSTQKETKAE